MAGSRKIGGGDIAGIVGAVAGIVTTVTPIVNEAMTNKKEKAGEDDWVVIPELYDKAFPLKMEQAVELLASYGLKAMPSMLTLREANVKYKDCFDGQIIGSKPKSNQKVHPGTTVLIRCVTQEVIDESWKMFAEAEARKAELKLERAAKRAEQKKRVKKAVSETAEKTRDKLGGMLNRRTKHN